MNSLSNQCSHPEVSFFQNFYSEGVQTYLDEIFTQIKRGDFKDQIEKIRMHAKAGENEKKDKLKKRLPCFTPSATFKGNRKLENFEKYSETVHLDYDKIDLDILDKAIKTVCLDPFTYACFLSVSGNGLKVFARVNSGAEYHKETYRQLRDHYDSSIGIKSDEAGNDIPRLCFVSYDPELYFNPGAQIFVPSSFLPAKRIAGVKKQVFTAESTFEVCVSFTEQKYVYYKGNRNNFIYRLACNCNRMGLPEDVCLNECLSRYDLTPSRIRSAVLSAYVKHPHEFAKFAKFATSAILQNDDTDEETDVDGATSTFPEEIFDSLPSILKEGCLKFTDLRERDVFLTGALAIISGCLPEVNGFYADKEVFPNIFCFVVAPAASGKGVLNFSKAIADKVHDEILKESQEAQHAYKVKSDKHRNIRRKNCSTEVIDGDLEPPPFKVHLIPANSSYAKVIWHLNQNEGSGTICESEADTMATVMKQEWGAYSHLLRQAFHHERISSSKKTGNEYIDISTPRLSVALSGTPSQVFSLISSAEDGLFSRFLFYSFRVAPLWHDVSPKMKGSSLNAFFKMLSEKVFAMYKFLEGNGTQVDLLPEQWARLNAECSRWLTVITTLNGDESGSIVKRIGLNLYRIAMILTAIRKYEDSTSKSKVFCTDTDFDIAFKLVTVFLEHNVIMFNRLPRREKASPLRNANNKQKFYEELPDRFRRSEAIEIAKSHSMKERTVDGLLKKLTGTMLSLESHGVYCKTKNL